MGWLMWAYLIGAIITMGAALGQVIRDETDVDLGRLVFLGALWPVMWVAVVAYAILEPRK